MTNPVYALTVELAVGSMTDITSFCERASFSRVIGDIFQSIGADAGTFELTNEVGSFSPGLQGSLLPGRRVKLDATYSGSSFSLYSGRIKSIATRPVIGERTTVIEAATEIDRMTRTLLNTGIFTSINAGSLYTEIMSRCSVQSFAVPDLISDTVDFAWYRDRSASNALDQLIQSGYYQAFTDGAGTINLRGRYFGVLGTPVSTVTQAMDMNYRLTDERVINSVKVSATPRKQISDVSTIAWIAQPIVIPASESLGFFVSFLDPRDPGSTTPVGSIVSLVSSQDYYAAANADGSGSDFTSTLSVSVTAFGESAVCSLFNGTGTDAYLTRFQIRGYPILSGADYRPQTDDSSSQAVYGLMELAIEESLITDFTYLKDFTNLLINERKEPRAGVSVTQVNEFPDLLSREVGDVLSIVNSITGINSMWAIRSMEHEISLLSGLEHRVSYELEGYTERNWLVLDHATFGKLDSGRQLGL